MPDHPAPSPVTGKPPAANRRVLSIFLIGLALVVLGYAIWDVHLYVANPDGSDTISYAAARMSRGGCFLFGLVVGSAVAGLASHFWMGMTRPEVLDELYALRAEVAQLRQVAGNQPVVVVPAVVSTQVSTADTDEFPVVRPRLTT